MVADQTAQMRRLVCAFVVHKPMKTGFLTSKPIYIWPQGYKTFFMHNSTEHKISTAHKIHLIFHKHTILH